MLNTVEEKEKFSKRQVHHSDKAQNTYFGIDVLPFRDNKHMVFFQWTNNCLVSIENINIAEKIYGQSIISLKRKTMKSKPPIVTYNIVQLLEDFKRLHQDVYIDAYILHVNTFCLATVSHNIDFVMTHPFANSTKKQLGITIGKVGPF